MNRYLVKCLPFVTVKGGGKIWVQQQPWKWMQKEIHSGSQEAANVAELLHTVKILL